MVAYSLGLSLLVVTIPAAILGTWASVRIAPDILKEILGVGLVTALIAASGHLLGFVQSGSGTFLTVLSLTLFTGPGVLLGGQIGPLVAVRISQRVFEIGLGILFILVAVMTLGQVLL
ncbi:MAG: hypothetical protein P8Z00_18465 [Anaerolineales bacterium]